MHKRYSGKHACYFSNLKNQLKFNVMNNDNVTRY